MVAASFDYLVGAAEQREWDGETERLCGLEVYNQLDLRRLHDRQVGRLLALEYFPGLDDRFHEAGIVEASIHGTGSMLVDSSFEKN
jgi:hypothetical protein